MSEKQNKFQLTNLSDVGTQIDKIVNECLPITSKQTHEFNQALILANGVRTLREIFANNQQIKATVQGMQDTNLGFLTDRSPEAIAKAQQNNKKIIPYTYEQVSECCIEAMLNGYRITNNEFNIIAERFYPAKNGKYRKIVEYPGVTDFIFTTTPPIYETEQRGQYSSMFAKVQCYASWKKDGISATIGHTSDGHEDRLVFKVRVNAGMGDDAVVGKALSKLFTRVLMRVCGTILPESSDVSDGDYPLFPGGTAKNAEDDLSDKIQAHKESNGPTEDQLNTLAGYKSADPTAYVAAKKQAKVKGDEPTTYKEADTWLLAIEAYQLENGGK